MDDEEVQAIVELSASCDQGHALHKVLDLLVAADLDDHIVDDPTEEELDRQSEAETALFLLASAWNRRNSNAMEKQ